MYFQTAIIYEADEPGEGCEISYSELLREVCRIANVLRSFGVLASVGEPIKSEAWNWYNDNVGKHQCAIVDTYWQTETGSIVVTPLPGAIPTKPGSATVPFFGITPVILDATSGKVRDI